VAGLRLAKTGQSPVTTPPVCDFPFVIASGSL